MKWKSTLHCEWTRGAKLSIYVFFISWLKFYAAVENLKLLHFKSSNYKPFLSPTKLEVFCSILAMFGFFYAKLLNELFVAFIKFSLANSSFFIYKLRLKLMFTVSMGQSLLIASVFSVLYFSYIAIFLSVQIKICFMSNII